MCFVDRNTSDFAYFCLTVEMTHKLHRYAGFNIYDRGKCSWERFAPFPCNEHGKQLTFLQFLSILVVPLRGIVTLRRSAFTDLSITSITIEISKYS